MHDSCVGLYCRFYTGRTISTAILNGQRFVTNGGFRYASCGGAAMSDYNDGVLVPAGVITPAVKRETRRRSLNQCAAKVCCPRNGTQAPPTFGGKPLK
jgi:CelD/BcsL family acetyltransferase involved in cellulose biosynthesis